MERSQTLTQRTSGHLRTSISNTFFGNIVKLLAFLLTVDLTLILIHVWWWTTLVFRYIMYDPNFSITHEGGYGERYQFAKEFWIVLLCGLIAVRQRAWSFAVWALLFSYILYADAWAVHEDYGGRIARYLPDLAFPGVVRTQEIGELAVFLVVVLAVLPLLALAYWRSSTLVRAMLRRLFHFVSILLCLAAGADFVQRVNEPLWWDLVWGIIEDGGELLIMSIILWYVLRLAVRPTTSAPASVSS